MSSQARRQRNALVILTGLALLVLVSIVFMLMHGLRQQAQNSARMELDNLTRVFQEHVARVISLTDKSMLAFRNAYVEDGPLFSLPNWLASNTVATDILPQIGVIGADGVLRMSTGTAASAATSRIDLSDREHFRVHVEAAQDFLFVSKPVLGRASGRWTIQLTRSIRAPDGTLEAVIVFSIDTEYLSQFYQSIDIGKSGSVMLIGSADGVVRAVGKSGDVGPNMGDDLSGRQLLREAVARPAGSFIVHVDGAEALWSYRTLPNLPLIVAVGARADDYLAPYNSKRPFILAFALVAALTILIMAAWLDVQLSKQARTEEKATLAQLAAADAETAARVRAEEDQRYRAATDSASDAIVSWHTDGELLFANPSARALFDLQDRAEVADVYAVLFPADEADRIKSLVHSLRRRSRGRGMTLEVAALRADGEIFTAEISLSAWRGQSGQIVTMVARDVSLRRQAEDERKELMTQAMTAQKMEAIGTLAGGIAHDFNNVLGAMQGFIWLAQQQCEPTGKVADLLKKAAASGDRAALVVRQLLDFSRANLVEMEVVDLADAIYELRNLATASIPATIACDFRVEGAPQVLGNATQIQQGLLNLLINASHAIGETQGGTIGVVVEETTIREGWFGGRTVVETETLPLVKSTWKSDGSGGKMWYGSLEPGRYAAIAVEDNGPGMSADVLRRIFEPFFTTKKVGEGTGLGLPVLLGTIKAMNGGIVVSSVVGGGTRFEMLIPLLDADAEPADAPAARASLRHEQAAAGGGTKTVLVVDDEEDLRRVAKETLEAAGFRVVLATDGIDALDKFDGGDASWSLVLTDWTMPRMSGERLIDELHRRAPDLPILLCTGRGDRIGELQALPVRAVLSKPVYGADLIRAVTAAIA